MKTSKIALNLYFTACLLAVIATFIDNEMLLLVSKPIIIPAIYFYYLSEKKTKINPLVVLFLILSFIGDTIVLLELKKIIYVMIPYFLSYLILLQFAISDVRKLKFDWFSLGVATFVFVSLILLLDTLVDFFIEDNKYLAIPILMYGLVLSVFGSLAGYYFYYKASNLAFYMVMAALFCVVSDVFYIIFSLIFQFNDFHYFDFSVQIISYYFIVKYFILRKR